MTDQNNSQADFEKGDPNEVKSLPDAECLGDEMRRREEIILSINGDNIKFDNAEEEGRFNLLLLSFLYRLVLDGISEESELYECWLDDFDNPDSNFADDDEDEDWNADFEDRSADPEADFYHHQHDLFVESLYANQDVIKKIMELDKSGKDVSISIIDEDAFYISDGTDLRAIRLPRIE